MHEEQSCLTVLRYQSAAVPPVAALKKAPDHVSEYARFCSVFVEANGLGWLLYPPFDADVRWKGGRDFEVRTDDALGAALWRASMKRLIGFPSPWWCSKIAGVLQIDVGMTFKTPQGVKLLLTPTINSAECRYWTHTGLLDSDWFAVPSTINLQMHGAGAEFALRRDEPIAQIVPLAIEPTLGKAYHVEELDEDHPSRVQWTEYIREAFGSEPSDLQTVLRPRIGTYRRLKSIMERDRVQ